ncbi:MAG: PilZ domain-containing protein [Alphaproteobacteria bacterium]|nr:PilZ domain-containing protein [Alphaproteobacteria bacterium]
MAQSLPRARAALDHDERRRDRHYQCTQTERIGFGEGSYRCMLENISAGGVRVTSSAQLPVGTDAVLYLDHYGATPGKVVYATGLALAMQFTHDEAARQRLQAWIETHLAT